MAAARETSGTDVTRTLLHGAPSGEMETGKYRAVIDRRYPLDQVLEAARYVGTGQKIGNVVLTVIS